MLVPLIVLLRRLVVVASPLVAPPSRLLVAPHPCPPRRPLTVPPSRRLIEHAGCCVASCRAAVLSSRRPLTAPPSRCLIAQAGCCIASHCTAVSSSHCATLASSHCNALLSSHYAVWLLRFYGTAFLRKVWRKICCRCRISRNVTTRTGPLSPQRHSRRP